MFFYILLVIVFSAQHSLSQAPEDNSLINEAKIQDFNEVDIAGLPSDNISNEEFDVPFNPAFQQHRPPQYLSVLLDEFAKRKNNLTEEDFDGSVKIKIQNQIYTKPRHRLIYAWLPTQISESNGNVKVTFQQTLPKTTFGNFTSSQITLTQLDDVEIEPNTYLKMTTIWKKEKFQQELIQTQLITPNQKFVTFVITDFITSSLQTNVTEPHFINILFSLYVKHSRSQMRSFESVFDAQVDRPLIIYIYHGSTPPEASLRLGRRTRSVSENGASLTSSRPASQCQRQEFHVTPAEVDWFGIDWPPILDLGYCSGTCQFPLQDDQYNFTLHSFLIDRYRLRHTLNVPTGFPVSKCVPISYKPLQVLESNGPDSYEISDVHNASVADCGCR